MAPLTFMDWNVPENVMEPNIKPVNILVFLDLKGIGC